MKLSLLRLNPTNPRYIKDDKFKSLVKSLKELPVMTELREVIVDENNVIIGGNMRYRAALEAGWTEIPTKIFTHDLAKRNNELTGQNKTYEEYVKEIIVKDNISGGDWDWDLLSEQYEKEELEEWGMDVDKWGEDEVVEDEVPEVTENPVSKLGEVYQLGKHRIMCGDSTKIEDVEKLMDGKKADMVFTDPPYGMEYVSHKKPKDRRFEMIQNDDKMLTEWIELALNYSTGWFLFCTGWNVIGKWLEIGNKIGKLTNLIVWDKGGFGMGDLTTTLAPDYEFILAFNRGNKIQGKRIGCVWSFNKDGVMNYLHPTQKPVALSTHAITHLSTGSVLDLFLGSGSTLIACEQTNRICYGMEIDPKYIDVIRKRYAKFIGKEEEWEKITPALK